eukprot:11469178-Alexandrium_andersonii.AAC.1
MLAEPPHPEPHPSPREPRKGSGKDRPGCHNCGHPAHFARDCPCPRKETRERHACGEVGHLAANCQQK